LWDEIVVYSSSVVVILVRCGGKQKGAKYKKWEIKMSRLEPYDKGTSVRANGLV
jgi:hypothetical protein